MQDIQKYTDRAGEDTKALKRALEVMCVVPKAANDMMQVGRLQGFDVSQILEQISAVADWLSLLVFIKVD